jgi:3-oxoacid CoA-transferase B subunit
MKEKTVLTAAEAVLCIRDGMTVMVGGFLGCGSPCGLLAALEAQGTRDMTLVCNDTALSSVDRELVNAGGAPVSILPGGCFFDSATSFAIIRGGHVDCTVLGALEVDQEGNLANYKVPGKLVPGMGGAMDLTVGAKKVIAATLHFDRGACKLVRRCTLPLTARGEVDVVVTDMGVFTIGAGAFVLQECFAGYTPQFIVSGTPAEVLVAPGCREVDF